MAELHQLKVDMALISKTKKCQAFENLGTYDHFNSGVLKQCRAQQGGV